MLTISLNAVRATYLFLARRRAAGLTVEAVPRAPGLAAPTMRELCLGFFLIGLTGFGGWLQARLMHFTVTEKKWLTEEEFAELTVTASLAPGGNSSNLGAELGRRLLGFRGMVAGYLCLLLPGLLIMLVLGNLYTQYQHDPVVKGALAGMESAAVALIVLAVVKLRPRDLSRAEGLVGAVACLAVLIHVPAVPVVLGSGALVYLLQSKKVVPA